MKCYDVSRLPSMIELGYDGENNWRPNSFDCSSLLANHPNGVISLWLLPQGESQAFPVALERDGNTVIWTPLSEEMTAATGAFQIVCTDGTDVGKSAVVMFRVDESILPGADHPAAVPSWATQVMEQYQNAIEHYPTIIDSTWHVWDVDNETWEDTGVSAQGVDGEDGHSPYIALNGHWMVYSDSTHEWIDTGVSASVDEAVIANAVAAYLDEHPITVTETDPTVPAWAKNPTKPTYTAQEVGALPADTPIPAAVTEQTVAGWGFTKNTGTYSKPSGGIPASDLASDVRASLGKADSALQEHQSLDAYRTASAQDFVDAAQDAAIAAKYTKPSGGIPASDIADGVIPTVPQMATQANMRDWVSGKTLDAGAALSVVYSLGDDISDKPDTADLADVAFSGDYLNLSNKPTIPTASTSAPIMDGTAATGSSAAYARGDHVHPSDTAKLATTGNAYRTASIPMGHLDATSTATVMTATVDGITELRDGVCMWLRNSVITSASGFTLNVNGLGAKPCYSSLAAASRSTTIFNVNYTMLFVYNSTRVEGGCWDIVYGVDTNTAYTPVKLGFGYGTCTTAAATAAKTASISSYALTTGGIVSIKFENDVPAGATLNITSKGAKAIYYRGAAITADVIKAGDTATFIYSTYYHLISIDRDEAGSGDAPIQTVKVNGTALVPDANKSVDIPVPTVADVIEETVMVVQLTPTSTDLSGTMNRTGSEILAAYSAGKRIVAEVAGLNGSFEWNQAINGTMVTQFLYSSGGGRELIQVVAESGSSTVYHAYHIAQLPTVTAADNGKFLRVVNGAWAAQAVPAAESNSFGGGA